MRGARLGGAAALAVMAVGPGCGRRASPPAPPPGDAVALSGGPSGSMVYLARVPGGIIAVDLGWYGADGAVRRALGAMGSSPAGVTDVFLTHSHRGHVGAWRLLRASRVRLAAAELPALTGARRHGGWIPRFAERLKPSGLPRGGELDARPFARDTVFAFGRDTLRAFLVPGHTAGSAAYLFRGVLFVGDAVTHTRRGGFAPARRGYSDDAAAAARNLDALWARLPAGAVRHVCTAHARCSPFTADFLTDVRR